MKVDDYLTCKKNLTHKDLMLPIKIAKFANFTILVKNKKYKIVDGPYTNNDTIFICCNNLYPSLKFATTPNNIEFISARYRRYLWDYFYTDLELRKLKINKINTKDVDL